ncbi:Gfo/Idh/MocA family oxidoreductase [bacterium]|nr:Gfo/Idh/MocA family oxidoreductase [bacterium]
MSAIRVGMIGVGHHGRHHARNLASLPDVKLVGVVDAHAETAKHVAETCQTEAFHSPSDLIGKVDAVCIAVPTFAHHSVASLFLKRGIAALVEKPLSLSSDEGRDIVRMAREHRALLMVGHIERFNPTWSSVNSLTSRPKYVESARFSRFPFRSLDVSVVFDVMIHDLDLVMSVSGSKIRHVEATGGAVLSPSADWAEVRLEFDSGLVANLSASRIHHTTERWMTFRSDVETLEVDFLRRTSLHNRLTAGARELVGTKPGLLTPEEKELLLREMFVVGSEAYPREIEPLRLELQEFVSAVREGREPIVNGEAGLEAVVLASRIEQSIALSPKTIPFRQSA